MPEEYLKIKEADTPAEDDMAARLVSMLQYLKQRAEENNANPIVKTKSLLALVQNTGYKNFGYADLVAANELPMIKNLIKSFNRIEVELLLHSEDSQDNDEPSADQQEKTVNRMAKHSLDKDLR